MGARGARITIQLGANRDRTGYLSVCDDLGGVLAGPFPVSARAADSIASENGNPTREPVLPFGDPPTGRYKVVDAIPTGQGTPYRGDLYGDEGAIVLAPVSGVAALADACGRFQILIHGGRPSDDGRLRMSSGNFRVFDHDLKSLIDAVKSGAGISIVECEESLDLGRGGLSLSLEGHDDGDLPERAAIVPAAGLRTGFGRQQQFVAFGEYSPGDPDPANLGKGQVAVDATEESPSIASQIGSEVVSTARDLGLDTLDRFGGKPIPTEGIGWTEPAAKLAGGLWGAAQLSSDGQQDAAIDAAKSTIVEIIPDAAGAGMAAALAPELIEPTLAVALGTAAMGVTLPVSAIVVTGIVITVGVGVAASMAGKKIAEVGIKVIKDHYGK
jgi:hypothetical protein